MRARTLAIASDGLTLEGEIVIPDDPRALVVLLHGFSGGGGPDDPSDPGYPGFARALATRGIAACWVNLRGVRTSPGDFALDGWVRDAGATIDAARAACDGPPVVLLGSSAGGYVALRAAARRADVGAVATFAAVEAWDDLLDDGAAAVAYLRNRGMIRDGAFPRDLDAWLEPFRAAGSTFISDIAPRPVLLVHGDADDVVPSHHGERLYEAARGPKELVRIPAGTHQLRRDPRALDAFTDWLRRAEMTTPR